MSEYNICGVLVRARPGNARAVGERLDALPGVQVHARSEDDRLVVTVEDSGKYRCVDTISSFNDVEGVIATSLVYQQTDHDEQQEPAS